MALTSRKKEFNFFELYEHFITDSKKGKRLQPNGKKLSAGTIANYGFTLQLLKKFSEEKKIQLRIRPGKSLQSRELVTEKNYWKKFYKRFTDYLYQDCGHFDNYVGQNIKNIRVFFNYLNKEKSLGLPDFHKLLYVRKEEGPIYPLLPEELNFLIYDDAFEKKLTKRMQEVKDFFVFGCTVALRVSDLLTLKKSNVRINAHQHYLVVRSQKTSTDTIVKLPSYAVDILLKYKKNKKSLLPHFNKSNLNKYIKCLLEQAGFTHAVNKVRERRGKTVDINPGGKAKEKSTRFCDLATTHTMRRTAITTMLTLGVPEQVVRKISGHSANSKEFYRYVHWAQTYQDQETDKMFEKLKSKKMV